MWVILIVASYFKTSENTGGEDISGGGNTVTDPFVPADPGNTENGKPENPDPSDPTFNEIDLIGGEEPMSDMFIAIAKNDVNKVSALVSEDSSLVNKLDNGATPLQYAVLRNSYDIASFLIKRGAQVNNYRKGSKSPLSLAAYNSDKRMAKLLIDNKADLNSKDKVGATPIIIACGRKNEEVALMLLDYKIDLNAKESEHGFTALHTAVMADLEPVVRKLVAKGADRSVKNNFGETPYEFAAKLKNDKIAEILK